MKEPKHPYKREDGGSTRRDVSKHSEMLLVQIKDGAWGWTGARPGNPDFGMLRVPWTIERLKELRAIVRKHVEAEMAQNNYNPGHGTMSNQALYAFKLAGISNHDGMVILNEPEAPDTGLHNKALGGHLLFSTIRVCTYEPPDTFEAAGEKRRWGRPMRGIFDDIFENQKESWEIGLEMLTKSGENQ